MNSSAIRENIDSAGTTLSNRMKVGGMAGMAGMAGTAGMARMAGTAGTAGMAGMAGMEREGYRHFTLLKSVYTADTEGESKLATVSADL